MEIIEADDIFSVHKYLHSLLTITMNLMARCYEFIKRKIRRQNQGSEKNKLDY